MKKYVAIWLSLVFLCCQLTSCGIFVNENQRLLSDAQAATAKVPHDVEARIVMLSDDSTLNHALSNADMRFPMSFDGDDLSFTLSSKNNGVSYKTAVVLAEDTLYYEKTNLKTDHKTQKKCTLTSADQAAFYDEYGSPAYISYNDFKEFSLKNEDQYQIITCTGLKEQGREDFEKLIKASLKDLEADFEMKDVSFTVTLENGKNKVVFSSFDYDMIMNGKTYGMTINIRMEYFYDNASGVTAPKDAASYQDATYDDLTKSIGGLLG